MKITVMLMLSLLLMPVLAHDCYAARNLRDTPVVDVVRNCSASVVNIRTEKVLDLKNTAEWGRYGAQLDSLLKEYYGKAYSKGKLKYKSIGSGVILNNKGLIVTNAHVVNKAKTIYIVDKTGRTTRASILALDRAQDLAILRTRLSYPVKKLKFADYGKMMIGETLVAIGDPFGLENSVTVGVLSGINREFSRHECRYVCSGLLQTDASINPGNSGGALLNLNGELVGINLAVVQNAQNIGFAVPAVRVQELLNRIK